MVEASCERLGIDVIDLYWIHNPADVERWTPELIPLLKSGRVKNVGVSNHNLSEIKRANEILGEQGFRISAVQNHFSLLNRSPESSGILDYCRENDIIFFAYMVLEQGALSGKYDTRHPFPEGSDRARIYNPVLAQLEELTAATSGNGLGRIQRSSSHHWRDQGTPCGRRSKGGKYELVRRRNKSFGDPG